MKGQEEYKRQVLEAMRARWTPAELVDRMEATWQAAYSADNPKSRSWKGMNAYIELVTGLLIGKAVGMELPAEGNAINALIQQVIAAKLAEPHLIVDVQAEEVE